MFNTIIGSVLTVMFSLSMSVLLYLHFYRGNTDPKESGNYVELSTLEANPINIVDNGIDDDIQSQGSGKIGSDREESNEFFSSDFEIDEEELKDSERLQPDKIIVNFPISSQASTQYHKRNFFPLNNWNLAVPLLLATSWIILNIDHYFSEPIYTEKDLVSWFSYVILHFCAPLFTAIWLYAFHPQGALKLFGMSLGLQNILGVLTHLAFPNAPPWFIHVYGPDHEANYEMEGYAAGLIRVDTAMGTHLHTNGFHKSPIVFGALPSLHSAMAVCVFFHLAYYSRWTAIKALGLLFVVVQWWATIYLDHHWRLDLYAGLLYAIGLFTLFTSMRAKVDERFFHARFTGDFVRGSTMGMRVFKNTRLQNFFDPLL
ncbi:uncharacterized protein KQ657_001249 [Scheffersomyces spartinae]|uniref:Phosphatidic acid phosphatase type 2/haloperoxidase domain-containing protein n=1 Tax=Scheffersomyces spartinae TaxID=45513 RepID=A0A9P8AI56_9ASCO|nr:uncharacterized protein KQ657_001249 [Scheffersomyces spartinae]KAG7192794.1 hypothetical protein KQ657_001249 [Scheffersomyces spartinae]